MDGAYQWECALHKVGFGSTRKSRSARTTFALPTKADIGAVGRHICFVPDADDATDSRQVAIEQVWYRTAAGRHNRPRVGRTRFMKSSSGLFAPSAIAVL